MENPLCGGFSIPGIKFSLCFHLLPPQVNKAVIPISLDAGISSGINGIISRSLTLQAHDPTGKQLQLKDLEFKSSSFCSPALLQPLNPSCRSYPRKRGI